MITKWMTHPTLPDALIEVPQDAVTGHQQSGWQITEPPEPEKTPDDLTEPEPGDDEAPSKSRPAGSRRGTAPTVDGKE